MIFGNKFFDAGEDQQYVKFALVRIPSIKRGPIKCFLIKSLESSYPSTFSNTYTSQIFARNQFQLMFADFEFYKNEFNFLWNVLHVLSVNN